MILQNELCLGTSEPSSGVDFCSMCMSHDCKSVEKLLEHDERRSCLFMEGVGYAFPVVWSCWSTCVLALCHWTDHVYGCVKLGG